MALRIRDPRIEKKWGIWGGIVAPPPSTPPPPLLFGRGDVVHDAVAIHRHLQNNAWETAVGGY